MLCTQGCPTATDQREGAAPRDEPEDWYRSVPVRTKVVTTKTLTAIGKVRSMRGPIANVEIILGEDGQEPELLWLVGYDNFLVAPDGQTPISQEYNCHSNFWVKDPKRYMKYTGAHSKHPRIFTLSQGQQSIRLPEGFGVPILSTEPLNLNAQILNLNAESTIDRIDIREIVRIHYLRQKDLQDQMVPLMYAVAASYKLLSGKDGYFGIEHADEKIHGPGCGIGLAARDDSPNPKDAYGRTFAEHWLVPPGRQVTRSLATTSLKLPYDTTIHYIAVHVHPFAESIELRDMTENKTIFKAHVKSEKDRVGIAHVDHYSSREGIPVKHDHEYEVVSVYNNTSGMDQDSMANMFLYITNKQFSASEFLKKQM